MSDPKWSLLEKSLKTSKILSHKTWRRDQNEIQRVLFVLLLESSLILSHNFSVQTVKYRSDRTGQGKVKHNNNNNNNNNKLKLASNFAICWRIPLSRISITKWNLPRLLIGRRRLTPTGPHNLLLHAEALFRAVRAHLVPGLAVQVHHIVDWRTILARVKELLVACCAREPCAWVPHLPQLGYQLFLHFVTSRELKKRKERTKQNVIWWDKNWKVELFTVSLLWANSAKVVSISWGLAASSELLLTTMSSSE